MTLRVSLQVVRPLPEQIHVLDLDGGSWSVSRDCKSLVSDPASEERRLSGELRKLGVPDELIENMMAGLEGRPLRNWDIDGVDGEPPSRRKKFTLHTHAGKLYVHGGQGKEGDVYDDLCLPRSFRTRAPPPPAAAPCCCCDVASLRHAWNVVTGTCSTCPRSGGPACTRART